MPESGTGPIARGPDGAPLAGRTLLLRDTATGRVHIVVTAADGRFALPPEIQDAAYEVTALAAAGGQPLGLTQTARPSELRSGEIQFRRRRGTSVTLRCVDDESARLRAVIEIRAGAEDAPGRLVRTVVTSADADTPIVLPREHTFVASLVRVPALGMAPVVRPTRTITTGSGDDPVSVEFRVSRTAIVEVSLLDERGEPLPEVFVYSKADLADGVQIQASGTTDAAGKVVLERLHPGDVAVLVCISGRPAVVERVGLQASEHRRLELTIPPGGVSLRGRLVGVPTDELATLNLAYRSAPVIEAFTVTTKRFGEGGAFAFTGLKPGDYDLHVVLKFGVDGFRRIHVGGASNDLGDVDVSPLAEVGTLIAEVVASVPRWSRGYYNAQYRRGSWPGGLWRFVRVDDGKPTRISLPEGTYTFRVTPESNATDGFRTVVKSGVVLSAEGPVPRVELEGTPIR